MSQQELLKRVIGVLDAHAIPYMLTGSIVSSIQGEPRSTHDIDLIVSITAEAAPILARAFPPPAYYLDESAIRDAVARQSMFNLLELDTGDKVDFWILTDDPFDRERFSRRSPEELSDIRAFISTPEDTILQKLRWSRDAGGSERQLRDALSIYELQSAYLDRAYLHRWGEQLGLSEDIARLEREAKPL